MLTLVLIILATSAGVQKDVQSAGPHVVFVCEHGAGKSVIAAAYFTKLAAERGLPFHAAFRGTAPSGELSVQALDGLRADGVPIPEGQPTALNDRDVAAATHIFAIGCTLPDRARASHKAQDWSDVPELSEGYVLVRDAIRRHLERLLNDLQRKKEQKRL